jgi:NADH-quinone oxidoreductase subunit N
MNLTAKMAIIKSMYFEDSDQEITVNAPMDMKLVLSINAVLILVVGLFPDFWMLASLGRTKVSACLILCSR